MTRWAGLAVAALAATAACAAPCADRVLDARTAPGARLQAVVFERDCGPPRPRELHVALVPPGRATPRGAGNALVLETAASDSARPARVTVEWLAPDRLKVSYSPRLRVLKSVRAVAGVRLEYVPLVEIGPAAFLPRPGAAR